VQDDDKFHVFQAVTAMFEAHARSKPSPAALKLYWDATCAYRPQDFQDAMTRAAKELKWPAKPAELREFCRDAKAGGPRGPIQHRCHFHGDGRYERGGIGRPDYPSPNPSMWWCDRCVEFVRQGKQQDPDARALPSIGAAVRTIADGLELP